MADLDQVLSDVQAETGMIDSLSKLTAGLKAQVDAITAGSLSPENQAKLDQVFTDLEANKQALADALTANTPAPTNP